MSFFLPKVPAAITPPVIPAAAAFCPVVGVFLTGTAFLPGEVFGVTLFLLRVLGEVIVFAAALGDCFLVTPVAAGF